MAIQLPNFLGVPVQRPDYSGLGDALSNYYSGKMMPKDDLIKAVQAQFAKPDAQATLLGLQLGNREKQLSIQKTLRDMAQEKAMNDAIAAALGGSATPAPVATPSVGGASALSTPSASGMPTQMPQATMIGSPTDTVRQINPALGQAVSNAMNQNRQPQPTVSNVGVQPSIPAQQAAQPTPMPPDGMTGTPMPTIPTVTKPNETVISEGNPRLAGIDALYDNNPLSRSLIEKRFGKKTQTIKFDNKTGRTSVITTYPSGKVTMQTMGEGSSGEGIPLTSKMISKHQNIISSIDNALPIIKEIQDLNEVDKTTGKPKYWEPYPRSSGVVPGLGYVPGFQSQSTKYEALVKSALDSLIGAYGLPLSNEGLETVKAQLLIGHGETDAAYKKRLEKLVDDLDRRKKYSENEVKRTNKIQPIGRMGNNDETYSSDEWDVAQ